MKRSLLAAMVIVVSLVWGADKKTVDEVQYVSATSGLILRSGPDTDQSKILILPLGTRVEILERKSEKVTVGGKAGSWVKVAAAGKQGWVFDAYLSPVMIGNHALDAELLSAAAAYDQPYDFNKIKALLKKGANPNAMSNRPVLHYVAARCNLAEINYLVTNGANINGRATYHPRPSLIFEYDVPKCPNYPVILDYFFSHGGRIDRLQVEDLWDETQRSLFENKFKMYIWHDPGESLLILSQYGDMEENFEKIKALLRDPSLSRYRSPHSGGTTALMMAAHYCNRRTIALLVEKGAEINAQDSSGDTVFHHLRGTANAGTDECSADVFRYLKKHGGDSKIRNRAGEMAEQQ